MADPFFSVIVPAFNRANYVGLAIQSILRQSFADFELIVVDDGSTDDTARIAGALGSRVQVFQQRNRGVSAARNRGVDESRGRWLAFLDSDDVWHENYLQLQYDQIRGSEAVVFQCADSQIVADDCKAQRYFQVNGMEARLQGIRSLVVDRPFSLVLKHSPWQFGSIVVDALTFKEVGGFDERLFISEDVELLARISLRGPARFLADCLVDVHRRGEAFDSLSVAADQFPMSKRLVHDTIYERLGKLPGMHRAEIRSLGGVRSANMRAIGRLYLDAGRRLDAAWSFLAAFRMSPSLRGLLRLGSLILP